MNLASNITKSHIRIVCLLSFFSFLYKFQHKLKLGRKRTISILCQKPALTKYVIPSEMTSHSSFSTFISSSRSLSLLSIFSIFFSPFFKRFFSLLVIFRFEAPTPFSPQIVTVNLLLVRSSFVSLGFFSAHHLRIRSRRNRFEREELIFLRMRRLKVLTLELGWCGSEGRGAGALPLKLDLCLGET